MRKWGKFDSDDGKKLWTASDANHVYWIREENVGYSVTRWDWVPGGGTRGPTAEMRVKNLSLKQVQNMIEAL